MRALLLPLTMSRTGPLMMHATFGRGLAHHAHLHLPNVRDAFAIEIATRHVATSVVDVGCGSGQLTRCLDDRLDTLSTIVGIDSSLSLVRRARREVGNIPFRHLDALQLHTPYAVATLSFVMHSLTAPEARSMLHHLSRLTNDIYILDVTPEMVDVVDATATKDTPCTSSFCADYRHHFLSVVEDFGGEKIKICVRRSDVTAWHIPSGLAEEAQATEGPLEDVALAAA